jgi:adenosylcobinamide-GDP ribazoletransferase
MRQLSEIMARGGAALRGTIAILRRESHGRRRRHAQETAALDKIGDCAHERPMDQTFLEDLYACLRFYSRLPTPSMAGAGSMPDFRRAVRALPLAGALIGLCGGASLLLARALGIPPLPAAACAIGALAAVSGALHEDGLADLADGFGGGATRERKLEIMRDSRLGSYGAMALIVSLILRVSALAAIAEHSALLGAAALIATGATSRAAGLAPLAMLQPARSDGAGFAALRPNPDSFRLAIFFAGIVSLLPAMGGMHLGQIALADFGALAAAAFVANLAKRQIGGFTGDVLGAAQQAAEIASLLLLSARY